MNRSTSNGGNGKGHFAKGNKGRPVGTRHKSTVNLLEIRRRIAGSWEACNGDQLLLNIAESDPLGYLKLVVALMPKQIDATVDMGKMEIVVRTEAGALFANRAVALHALNGKLEPAQVLEAFRQAKRDEMELAKQENTQ